jgi:hypothetical protein
LHDRSSDHVPASVARAQLQAAPQPHFVPHAQAVGATGFWQPQVQVDPAQLLQPQVLFFASFMMSLQWGGLI